MIVDLILLGLGGLIAVTGSLDPSTGVIPVAAATVIVACLVTRRLPFVLSAILAVVAVALLCEAFALPRHVDYWNWHEDINGLPSLVLCCVLSAALTLILIVSYRPSPEARTGHDLRSTGIITSIVLALAAMVSVVFVDLLNGEWCNQQSDSPCRSDGLFELPVLLGQVIPFGVVIVVLLYATWTRRRRLASGAAVASAFLCGVTAAVDLAMFYAYPYDAGQDVNAAVSYAVGALLVAAVIAGITAAKPNWVRTLMTR